MNPLLTTKQETFRAGTDKLEFFRERLLKMNNGALMFCTRGEANITIDLRKYHIVPNTHITLPTDYSDYSLFNPTAFTQRDRFYKRVPFISPSNLISVKKVTAGGDCGFSPSLS